MENKKQSSIEWLFVELWNTPKDKFEWHSILRKAKAMHKEEMESAYLCGSADSFNDEGDFKKYYNETFGGQDNE